MYAHLRADPPKWRAFTTVNLWLPAWRYNAKPCRAEDVEDYLKAVRTMIQWIEANI